MKGMEAMVVAWALKYAAHGWPVLPLHTIREGHCTCGNSRCESPGKHPIGKLTPHGLKDATTDPQKVKTWWTRYPSANVGILTGTTSKLVVVDIDPRHGGEDSLTSLILHYGPLPDAPQQLTGGGGRHILFEHPGNEVIIPNTTKLGDLPGIDLKADGGYIVACPSLHISGKRYIWEISSSPDDTPLAPIPNWLLNIIAPPSKGKRAPVETDGKSWLAIKLQGVKEGERNQTCFDLAVCLKNKRLPEDAALLILTDFGMKCTPPLEKKIIQKCTESAYSRNLINKGGVSLNVRAVA